MPKPSALPDLRRGDDAADRPGLHHRRRALRRHRRRHDAAVGAHDRERAAEADVAEAGPQAPHIAADLGSDIGVHHRGRHALELPVLAQDLVREREVGVRQGGADHVAGGALVGGIDVGVQEADRHRLDALGRQHAASFRDAGAIERHVHLTRRQHALVHLTGEMARHQRPMTMEQQIVGLRPVAAADDVHVAGAAGDDQAGLGALAFDQRVDGDGRAVDQLVDGGGGEAALADAVDDALHQLGRRGQALGLDEPAGGIIEPDQVGEGASDIDGDDDHAIELPPRFLASWPGCAKRNPGILSVLRTPAALRAPAVGRRRKISNTSPKGKNLDEFQGVCECGRG